MAANGEGKEKIYEDPPQGFVGDLKRGISNFLFQSLDKSPFQDRVNEFLENKVCSAGEPRPAPLSTMADYPSWESLTNKEWNGRHCAPLEVPPEDLPSIDSLMEFFKRKDGEDILDQKSTMLFPTFAQWLTDGFIMSKTKVVEDENGHQVEEIDWKKNMATHNVDLNQIYGRMKEQTDALRLMSEEKKGRLKSQIINGEEYAPFLFIEGKKVDPQFEVLDRPSHLSHVLEVLPSKEIREKVRKNIFAFGGSRSNVTPGVSALNTLMLRSHNFVASKVEEENPSWDDERVFQVTRNIMIVIAIKLTIEEYINHISSSGFSYRLKPDEWIWEAPWNKQGRITTEFSVLYRWHSLIPNNMVMNGKTIPVQRTVYQNYLALEQPLKDIFIDLSAQRATAFGPFNTGDYMLRFERNAMEASRTAQLTTYANYVEYLGLGRPKKMEDISVKPEVLDFLNKAYSNDVNKVELYIGLVAADHKVNSPFSLSMVFFVALDAFSQVLNNPLIQRNLWKESTYGKFGWELVNAKLGELSVKKFLELTSREKVDGFVGMTLPGWKLK